MPAVPWHQVTLYQSDPFERQLQPSILSSQCYSCRWALSGEARARQCLLYRGILPLIADKPSAADAIEVTDRQLEFALQHVRCDLHRLLCSTCNWLAIGACAAIHPVWSCRGCT